MYLFFDTETSGMIERTLPPEHESQPRLVQLGLILTDEKLEAQAEISVLVRPDGATFDSGAVKVHGISEEHADRFGVPLETAVAMFTGLCDRAQVAVAHNIEFDIKVMKAQCARAGLPSPFERLKSECTMALTQPLCMLDSRRGSGFKPPTLSEAYKHFFGKPVENAHDALADCRACLAIYQQVKKPASQGQLSLF